MISYWTTLHEATFGLQTPAGGRAMAVMHIKTQLRGQKHPCPLWGVQLYLRPLTALRRAAICPPSAGKTPPPTHLVINGNGFGVLEATASMPADTWPPLDDEQCRSSSCDRSHDISFAPPSSSHLQVVAASAWLVFWFCGVAVPLRNPTGVSEVSPARVY